MEAKEGLGKKNLITKEEHQFCKVKKNHVWNEDEQHTRKPIWPRHRKKKFSLFWWMSARSYLAFCLSVFIVSVACWSHVIWNITFDYSHLEGGRGEGKMFGWVLTQIVSNLSSTLCSFVSWISEIRPTTFHLGRKITTSCASQWLTLKHVRFIRMLNSSIVEDGYCSRLAQVLYGSTIMLTSWVVQKIKRQVVLPVF